MKKIISLALVFTFCLLALISCAKIEKDPMDLVKNLRKNGYSISMTVDEESIEDTIDDMDFEIDEEKIICIIEATDEDEEYGTFIYCKNKKTAKDLMTELEDLMSDDDYEDYFEDYTLVKKGKAVYFGTEGLLKDAK